MDAKIVKQRADAEAKLKEVRNQALADTKKLVEQAKLNAKTEAKKNMDAFQAQAAADMEKTRAKDKKEYDDAVKEATKTNREEADKEIAAAKKKYV